MKRYMVAAISALVGCLLIVSLIAAQSSSPLNDTFSSDASGWAPVMHQYQDGSYVTYATVTWLASKDLATVWPPSLTSAAGVIKVAWTSGMYLPDIQKTVYLQAGNYQVKVRAGTDGDTNMNVMVFGGTTNTGNYLRNISAWINSQWAEKTTDVFTVIQPGPVTVQLSAGDVFYVDSVEVAPYTTGDVPTPYTTQLVTAIPPEAQATAMPVPTQYCRSVETSSGPATFGVTPTPAPDTSGDWSFSDTFAGQTLSTDWEVTDAGATVNTTIFGPDNATGALVMPFSTGPELVRVHPMTESVFVDGWAMANALPIGQEARVHVALYNGSTWDDAGSQAFSVGQWYPFHISVPYVSGSYAALAIYVTGPSGDSAYLDNLYIYNSVRGAPLCGFAVTVPDDHNGMSVVYPYGKPCPPDNSGIQDVPNNFWGPLFYWMSVQFLNITGPFPMHLYQGYALAIEEFTQAPFWRYVQVATMMVDLRPIFAMALVLIALEVVRLIYSIWRLILKIIPMMG